MATQLITNYQIYAMRAFQGGRSTNSSSGQDELAEYLAEKQVPFSTSPINYWLSNYIVERWPRLSRMAIDILTIPAISAEPERIFSLAGILITKRRNRLKDDVIKAHECLSSWDRSGLIQIGGKGGVQLNQVDDRDTGDAEVDGDDMGEQLLFSAYKRT